MRDDQRFEIERALDLLPHVVGSSWTTIWFRMNGTKHPTREEYRKKVVEYLELLDPLFESLSGKEGFQEISEYIQKGNLTIIYVSIISLFNFLVETICNFFNLIIFPSLNVFRYLFKSFFSRK